MTEPELHRPIPVERVGPRGLTITVTASPEECLALAARMHLPAIRSLTCTYHLSQEGRTKVMARGTLNADLTLTCVVSLEEFDSTIHEDFRVRFVPEEDITDDVNLDDDDEVPIINGIMDLGEATAEQLSLTLEPYPRKPGLEPAEPPPDPTSPFAALRRLKPLN